METEELIMPTIDDGCDFSPETIISPEISFRPQLSIAPFKPAKP